jgi:alpha-L-fucosidase
MAEETPINRREFHGLTAGALIAAAAFAPNRVLAFASAEAAASGDWFSQARLGMFIHWGIHSVAANSWKGKRYYGISEWLMERAKIPTGEYATLASQFNPKHFDPKAWARAAREAGFKYLVITAKHHDGFAMFGSKASKYNVVDATPYGRDVMKEVTDAYRAEGLHVGFYYSQSLDWHERDAYGNEWEFPKEGRDFQKYMREKAIPQIKELLSNYGKIDIVWFDMPEGIAASESKALYDLVKQYQPQCLASSRIGNGLGDFTTYGDAEIPSHTEPGQRWEAIFTHNDSWGFTPFDLNFKPATELIHILALVASRGGNLLLNMGPDGDGRIPDESLSRIKVIGQWLQKNGESIYGTMGVPLPPQPWGVATQRKHRFYLHVQKAASSGRLVLPVAAGAASSAKLLVGGANVPFKRTGNELELRLPTPLPDARDTVIVLDHDGGLSLATDRPTRVSRDYTRFELQPAFGQLEGGATHKAIDYHLYFGDWHHVETVAGLDKPEAGVSWNIDVTEPGEYRFTLNYAADGTQAGREGALQMDDRIVHFAVLETGPTGSREKPLPLFAHSIGNLLLPAGKHKLRVKPLSTGGELFLLKSLVIEPID